MLGPVEVTVGERRLKVARGGAELVVARLALSRDGAVSSEDLAAQLWPGDLWPEREGSLRTVIWRLRRAWGDHADLIATTAHGYVLDVAPEHVDAHRFEALVGRGTGEGVGPVLERARREWRGPLAGRSDLVGWLDREQRRLGDLRRQATLDLVDHHRASGSRRHALDVVQAALLTWPDDERFAALHAELVAAGSTPLDELTRAHERALVEVGLVPPGRDAALPSPLEPLAAGTTIGRDGELAVLRSVRRDVVATRRGAAVQVTGDAGIGKSQLVAAFCSEVVDAGGRCVYGRAPRSGGDPYGALVEAATSLSGEGPPDGAADLLAAAGGIAATVSTSDLAGPPPVGLVHHAFRRLVAEAAGTEVLTVVLDDLHWADAETHAVVRHLVSQVDELPVLLVLVSRRSAGERLDPAVERTIAFVSRAGHRLVELGPLDAGAITELARLHDHAPEGEELALLAALSGGNPLHLDELLRGLRMAGTASDGGVGALVVARLERLGDEVQLVLRAASVVATPFDVDLVVRLTELAPPVVIEAIQEALAASFLVAERGRGWRFAHDVVREAIYGEFDLEERCRLHAAAAAALQDASSDAKLDEIAEHLYQAQPLVAGREVADAAVAAGRRAYGVCAFARAADWFEIAAAEDEGVSGERLGEILTSLAIALDAAGRSDTAEAALRVAIDDAILRRSRRDQLRLVGSLGTLWRDVGAERTRRLFDSIEAMLEPGDLAERAIVGSVRLRFDASAGVAVDRQDAMQVLELARASGSSMALARVLADWRRYVTGPAALDERLAAARELRVIAVDEQDPAIRLEALLADWLDRLEGGTATFDDEGFRTFSQVSATYPTRSFPWLRATADAARAILHGAWSDADELIATAHADGEEQVGAAEAESVLLAQTAVRLWSSGNAEAMLQGVGDDDPRRGPAAASFVSWSAGIAALAAEAGDLGRARRLLDAQCATPPSSWPQSRAYVPDVCLSLLAASHLGDRERIAELAALAGPYRDRNASFGLAGYIGAVSFYLGVAALAVGDHRTAVDHLEHALERHREMSARPLEVFAAVALASALRAGNGEDDPRAARLAEGAERLATQLLGGWVPTYPVGPPSG